MDGNSEASDQIRLVTYRRGTRTNRSTSAEQPGPGRYGATHDPEGKGYLSDGTEYSLPSIRAEMARSMHYKESRERGDRQREKTPLLSDSGLHETESEREDGETLGYGTLSPAGKKYRAVIVW